MAAESVVKLILQGQDAGASAALSAVGGATSGLGGLFAGLASPAGIAVAAVAGIGTALVGVGVAAFSASEELSTAMRGFQAETGIAAEDLAGFESVATSIFNNNWGESLTDVVGAMTAVRQATGASGDQLENLTQNALIMRDVFGEDVAQSTDAARVLMDQFGLSGDQAFDLITTGIQNGLNANGDFLDTIREYGNQFGAAGFTASEFYSVLETGAAGGVLGTDKIADSVKEMGVIIREGGDGVKSAFEAMGLDFEVFQSGLQNGTMDIGDAFPTIVDGINSIEDPLLRSQAQVAVFGTMAEDLGPAFTEGLSTASTSLNDMSGATAAAGDAVSQGLGPAWETFTRTIQTALIPLGDLIAGVLIGLTPYLESFGAWLGETIPVATEGLRQTMETVWPIISGAIQTVWDFVYPEILQPLQTWLGENAPGALEALRAAWVDTVWPAIGQSVTTHWEGFKTTILTLKEFFGETLPTALDTARENWETNWANIQTATAPVADFLTGFFEGVQNFADWLANHLFSFNISWPDVPEWMIPGSPIPLHTAWEDFGNYLDRNTFRFDFDTSQAIPPGLPNAGPGFLPAGAFLPASGAAGVGGNASRPEIKIEKIEITDSKAARLLLDWLSNETTLDNLGAYITA